MVELLFMVGVLSAQSPTCKDFKTWPDDVLERYLITEISKVITAPVCLSELNKVIITECDAGHTASEAFDALLERAKLSCDNDEEYTVIWPFVKPPVKTPDGVPLPPVRRK